MSKIIKYEENFDCGLFIGSVFIKRRNVIFFIVQSHRGFLMSLIR